MNPAIDLGCSDLGCNSASGNQSHDTAFDERGGSPVPSPTAAMTMSAASKIGKVNRFHFPGLELGLEKAFLKLD